jgi:PAS domain S-box-containing protein
MKFRSWSRRAVAWVGGLFIAAIVALAAYDIVASYQAAVVTTGRELEAQARLIAEQTARSFQAVDLVLRHIAQEHQQGAFDRMSARQVHNYLREQSVGLVQIEGLILAAPSGAPLASSLRYPLPETVVNVAGFPIFQALKEGHRGMYVDDAVKSPVDGVWNVPLARRLESADGRFAGAIGARGRIEYFEQFYRNAQLDPSITIALMRQNGTLLARHPRVESAFGQRFPLFDRLAAVNIGVIRDVSPIDGVERFAALKLVPDYPVAVVVTRDAAAALGPWRVQSVGTALRTLALSALAAALLFLLLRQLGRAQASQERFALAVAGSNDGIVDWDVVDDRMFSSKRAMQIVGIDSDVEVRTRAEWRDLVVYHPEDAPRMKRDLDDFLEGRTDLRDGEYRVRMPSGEYRWIRIRNTCVRDARGRPLRVAGSVSDINAYKRAEEALRLSEERYALAVAGSDDGVWDFDFVNRRVFASARARELCGLPPGPEVQQMDEWFERLPIHPEDAPQRVAAMEAHMAGKTPAYEGEWRMRQPDGRYRWTRIHGLCIRDADGRPHRMAGSISDVDARRRFEDSLRQSEEQYRSIFNAAADALVLRDAQARVIDVNAAFLQISGFTREEVMGQSRWIFAVPEMGELAREMHRRVIAGESVRFEIQAIRKDGQRIDIEMRAVPIRHRGEPHALGMARDITAQKRAEQLLRASEEQYRAIFNGAADALIVRDADARVIDVNPAFEQMIGWPRDEIVGTRWTFSGGEPTGFARQVHERVIAGESLHFELRSRRKDGSFIDLDVRAVPLMHRGQPHTLAMARDITAQKQAAAERQRLQGQLLQAKKLEAIGTLAGGIAHDFNNILAAIVGYGDLAQKNAPEGTALKRHIDAVVRAGQRGKSLVARILAFSRSGVGERTPINVQSVVAEALDLLAPSLPAHVRLERRLAAGDAAVMGDATQIHQVVMNLCTNAVQAMKADGVLTVGLDAVERAEAMAATSRLAAGRYVSLSVGDTGVGMAPHVLERIFDPFFTTREVGVGTGLGLSLVHGIVTDLGGGIDVESRPGEGTTFTVYLPWTSNRIASAESDESPPLGDGETILLVDDEEPLVRLGEEMLAGLGYEPVGFSSSEAALQAFRKAPERFHAVLSDEAMPEMTGADLAKEIRTIRPDMPILLMTGYASPLFLARARNIGVAEVLTKPLAARDIGRVLAALLRENKQRTS